MFEVPQWLTLGAGAMAFFLGLVSVFCSVMVYVDTKREFWSMWKTLGRFVGSSLVGAFAVLSFSELVSVGTVSAWLSVGMLVSILFKAVVEASLILPAREDAWSFSKKSGMIQLYSLRKTLSIRWAAFAVAAVAAMFATLVPALGALILPAVILGELLERCIFFQAVVTLKMPGELSRIQAH
ncbi:hypothetical protein [Rubritalea marina]|uniref:hypothetical protein n=1 Tax=Rubritalea marina TaxID=361055 RepID=UPI0012E9E7CB|nr:hypothetical protein [Rubritalea marina]